MKAICYIYCKFIKTAINVQTIARHTMSYRCVRKSEPASDRDSIYLALTYDTPMTNNAMSVDDEESTVSPRIKRKYIDPWDLENYSYLHRYSEIKH